MPINMTTAKKLCTKAELELVVDSTSKRIAGLTPAELRSSAKRARTLRDKYRTLASRQRRIARGKQEKRGARPSKSNENTVRKQEIFDEALQRFEARLAAVAEGESGGRGGKAGGGAARKKKSKKRPAAGGERSPQGSAAAAEPAEAAPAPAPKLTRGASPRPRGRQGASSVLGAGGLLGGAAVAARNTSLSVRSAATKGKRVLRQQQQTNRPAIRGHVSARGRRSQARRDSK